jgi:endonuclease I
MIYIFLFIVANMYVSAHGMIRICIMCHNTPTIYSPNCINQQGKLSLEHVFPKSLMYKRHYNDMHNIFKCDAYINNMRSNYKFVDNYDANTFIQLNDTDNYMNSKLKLFKPNDESKGIIARAIMHMCHEYKYDYKKIIDYEDLINWFVDYPPTKEEIYHNNIIFQKQKKRNMFIDLYNKKNFKKLVMLKFL